MEMGVRIKNDVKVEKRGGLYELTTGNTVIWANRSELIELSDAISGVLVEEASDGEV